MFDCGSKLVDFSVLVGRVKRLKSLKSEGCASAFTLLEAFSGDDKEGVYLY